MVDIVLFTFEQWTRENQRVIDEAESNGLKFDPSKRNADHELYGMVMFEQFPDEEPIEVQIAYLLKNLICAQRFEYGNKRTAHRMVRQFSEINGYHIGASLEEWVKISKWIQKRIPKKYVIDNPTFEYNRKDYLETGSGGGYAIRPEAITMSSNDESLQHYNHYILGWVREHLKSI